MWTKTREQVHKIAIWEYEIRVITDRKHSLMHFQGGTCSFRAGVAWPGLCQAGLHNSTWHNCPWNADLVFVPFCHCHYWQQGNAQCFCVWKHALLSDSLCGLFLWIWISGNRAWVSRFLLSLGAQDFTQLPAMALLSILSCHFLPSCWICFTCTPCPHSVPGQQERAGDVSCLFHWTYTGGSCLRRGIFVAGCKCHPWSLESACWLHPRWPLQRGEKQQLRHSLLLLHTPRRYF